MNSKMHKGMYRRPGDADVGKHMEDMKETSAKLEPAIGMAATVLDEWEDQIVYHVGEIQTDGTLVLRRDHVTSDLQDDGYTYVLDPEGGKLWAEKHEDGQWHVRHAIECCLVLLWESKTSIGTPSSRPRPLGRWHAIWHLPESGTQPVLVRKKPRGMTSEMM